MKKTKRKNLRMTEFEFNEIQRLSSLVNMKMEHYILKMALTGKVYFFSKDDVSKAVELNETLAKLIYELNAYGRNINQITRVLNQKSKQSNSILEQSLIEKLNSEIDSIKEIENKIESFISDLPSNLSDLDKIMILQLSGYYDLNEKVILSEEELKKDLNIEDIETNSVESISIENKKNVTERTNELIQEGLDQFQAYLIAQKESEGESE